MLRSVAPKKTPGAAREDALLLRRKQATVIALPVPLLTATTTKTAGHA